MASKVKRWVKSRSPKVLYLWRVYKNKPFKLLDIGAGNHSASKTCLIFPSCEYYGLDLDRNYNNGAEDFAVMKGFYEMDLTKLDFSSIPDNFFDCMRMVHVIEHLHNGDRVLEGLLPKLKSGGYFYIEYPGQKSTTLPSMYGTLNFSDDPTHVRIYSVPELANIFSKNYSSVLKSGTRRNIYYLSAMPFRIIKSWLTGKKLQGNIFWDLFGFAEFLWVKKN